MAAFAALPLALKALGVVTTGATALPVVDYLGGMGKRREEELIKRGPNEISGEYDSLGWWDKQLVDEESLKGKHQKYELKQIKKENPVISDREAIAGVKPMMAGETLSAFLRRTDEAATKYDTDKAINQQRALDAYSEGTAASTRARNQEKESQRRYEMERAELRNERDARERREARQWADQLGLRQDDLDFRRQQQTEKMDIYRQQLANQRADKKQERMMALIQGLATLGSGFAL